MKERTGDFASPRAAGQPPSGIGARNASVSLTAPRCRRDLPEQAGGGATGVFRRS